MILQGFHKVINNLHFSKNNDLNKEEKLTDDIKKEDLSLEKAPLIFSKYIEILFAYQ